MKLTPITLASLTMLTAPVQALAVEPEAFAEALTALFNQADTELRFDRVDARGDDIVIDGASLSLAGEGPLEFDVTIEFLNVGETDDGGYTADRAIIDRLVMEEDEFRVQVDGLVWENVLFHALPPTDPQAGVFHPSQFFTGPLRLFVEDSEVFRISRIESGNAVSADEQSVSFNMAAAGMKLDLVALEELEELPPELAELDVSEITMELGAQSQWDVASGQMEVSGSFIDISEVGRFEFAGSILGYDLDFLGELLEMQRASVEDGAVSEAESMDQMMHMANSLFLNGARLRFDDDGITNKLLDMAAEEQDMPRAAMTIGFAAALPIMASELGVSEALSTALLRAATDYMISPQSFEVRLLPNKPVRFSRLAEAVEGEDAEALIGMFNFEVEANQPRAD